MKIPDALDGVSKLGIDSVALIYYIEKNPVYFERMAAIMQQVQVGNIRVYAATLVLTEVLVHPFRYSQFNLARQYQHILTNSRGFVPIALDVSIARKAAELRAGLSFKTPDAIHAATAIVSGCDAFLTNDTGFKRLNEIDILILDDLELDPEPEDLNEQTSSE